MDFLSSDGFPVTLDGAIEFRVIPGRGGRGLRQVQRGRQRRRHRRRDHQAKIITPESRSLCRTGGSKLTGGQFISGIDREVFQRNLVKSLTENCQNCKGSRSSPSRSPGSSLLRTSPRRSATARSPSRKLAQFNQEKLQQLSEAKLGIEVLLAEQKQKVVRAEAAGDRPDHQGRAGQQRSPVTLAEQKLSVTQTQLEAAKDQGFGDHRQGPGRRRRDPVHQQGRPRRPRRPGSPRSTATARRWLRTSSWASSPPASARS